jgi:hypothetical protein
MKKMLVVFFLVAGLTASSSLLESPVQATEITRPECILKCEAEYAQRISQCGGDIGCRFGAYHTLQACLRVCNPGPHGD